MIGTRLAHYEITSHLGTGGMGEVYQATDSKLGRNVAIKLLPEAFTHDHDRASRFEREARALAALNHPNIAAIYGVEETGGRKFLVMELVTGETLAEKINRGPLPFDEAMVIAREIAVGLEAAHEKGVIHRDLKPANIKVTPDGKVKILDFGLAKAYDTDTSDTNVSNSPTISVAATNAGIILGTAGYMSPEQASGRPVDKRADIWSFGVVLWEMLTGHTLFGGETVSHMLADVLRGPIDFNALPATVSEKVRKLLRRCLDRDAKSRLRDIGEARIDIDERVDSANPVAAPPAARSSLAWILVAALLAIALSALAFTHFREPAASQGAVIQTEITLPEEFRIGVSVLSPDGTKMVFAGSSGTGRVQLYVRPLAARSFTTVPGSELASTPFWSPNSESIAFGKDGKLWKWSLTSGQPPQIICNADIQPNGQGTWSEQDIILFAEADKPIQRVPASGGIPRNALELDSDFGEQAHVTPSFLPGGKAFLYSSNGKVRGSQFFATLDGKIRRHLQDSLNSPPSFVTTPSGTGFLVYVSNEQLLARRMNSDTGELTGDAALLIDGIVNGPTFSFASGRYLTYIPRPNRKSRMRWIVDGKPGEVLGEAGQLSGTPDVSADGRRILYSIRDAGKYETWLLDLTHGTPERLLSGNTPQSAIWTPDNRIVYSRNDANVGRLIERPADTLGAERILASIPGNAGIHIRNISNDGTLIAVSAGGGGLSEAWLVSRPEGKIRIAKVEGRSGGTSELSPNGRWLAQFTGREIVLRPVPADADAPLASGGQQIASLARSRASMHWSADGNQLLGISEDAMMSIPIDWTGGTPHAGPPRKLFDAPKVLDFDVTADSHRFLVLENVGEAPNPIVVLIQNWPALLGN